MFIFLFLSMIGVFLKNIIIQLNEILINYGISSRTLDLLMQDNIHLSGRDVLYQIIIKNIAENPILGIGLAGDRKLLGTYSHNFLIEILSGFGVVIGGTIIVLIILISYWNFKSSDEIYSNLFLIWFSVGFLPLLVSGSYLTDFSFWIFLGIAIRGIKNKKRLISY